MARNRTCSCKGACFVMCPLSDVQLLDGDVFRALSSSETWDSVEHHLFEMCSGTGIQIFKCASLHELGKIRTRFLPRWVLTVVYLIWHSELLEQRGLLKKAADSEGPIRSLLGLLFGPTYSLFSLRKDTEKGSVFEEFLTTLFSE